ncbi:MAG: hypothetical protein IPK26_15505 [Planctomycetes bacterium]|nr:hypothetical protein [Planctomycetota bacterium]
MNGVRLAPRWLVRPLLSMLALASACVSPAGELRGLAADPPLEYSVLVTGQVVGSSSAHGTFAAPEGQPPMTTADLVQVLRAGRVFLQAAEDDDPAHRQAVLAQLASPQPSPELLAFLQQARDRGHDLLLVLEQLEDGPVDAQGVNERWPITLATWLLLGVGAFIPDHTFESRATLRVTLRDLQTGRIVHDPRVVGGPVDLSLIERTDFLGLVASLIVPPFWVHDDAAAARAEVRHVTARRLLLSLARDLKSAPVRQRLRERLPVIELVRTEGATVLRIDVDEALARVQLRRQGRALDPALGEPLERELLASVAREGSRFVYRAPLQVPVAGGPLQVLIGTIAGNVASVTLAVEAP